MSDQREEVRRDAEWEPCPACGCPGDRYEGHVCEDYLKARAEQAERERDERDATIRHLRGGWDGWQKAALESERELELRQTESQAANELIAEQKARLASVPALVEAALQVLDSTTSDEVHKEARRALVEALTVYEQSQGSTDDSEVFTSKCKGGSYD